MLERIISSSPIECQQASKNDPRRRVILRGALDERSLRDWVAATADP